MWGLVLSGLLVAASAFAQTNGKDPDQLYRDREQLSSARQAADIWEARLAANPKDFEAAWKLARACYWLGGHVPADEQRQQYERGMKAATRAIEIEPDKPDGHFWLAADMGAMAEGFGLRNGIRYRAPIKKELETVLKIDPAYQQGSADRALGRWYFRVPRLFGGSKDKAVEHLKQSLTHGPESTASHFFLAETYLDMDKPDDARREAQLVLDAPVNQDWAPEDREFKQKAKALLAKIK
jgi:tetratricopeptide (TPR) repeat protein